MSEKQKPTPEIVKKAAHFLKHPEDATPADIKSMAARLMDDQRNDTTAHKAVAAKPKIKIVAAPIAAPAKVAAKAAPAKAAAAPAKPAKKSKAA